VLVVVIVFKTSYVAVSQNVAVYETVLVTTLVLCVGNAVTPVDTEGFVLLEVVLLLLVLLVVLLLARPAHVPKAELQPAPQ